jgi:hypothetical protein
MLNILRKHLINIKYNKDDYSFFFSSIFFIFTIVTTILSIVIPIILRSRTHVSELNCLSHSITTNAELLIYNKDTTSFGTYYINIDSLKVTLFKPLKPIVYNNYYIYNTTGDKVLTSRKKKDIFNNTRYVLSLEPIIKDDITDSTASKAANVPANRRRELVQLEESEVVQKWYLENSTIHSPLMDIKITVNESGELKVIRYGILDETSCSWIFEEYKK